MHHVRKWKKFKQKYEFSGLCNDELSHQCTVIYGEKYRIFRLLYSLKCVWKYIFMQYWSTILFRISVQHFAGIFPKHYSRDEVLLFLAPVRKIIKIFTTLVRKKYDWICSAYGIFSRDPMVRSTPWLAPWAGQWANWEKLALQIQEFLKPYDSIWAGYLANPYW